MRRLLVLLTAVLLLLVPQCAAAADIPADGQYLADVVLSGGSGRAAVESPALLTVADGSVTAVLVWSSPFYEFVIVDDITYYPVQEQGNAVFQVPVVLDMDMPISAQTVAMSQPYLVDYTLRIDSAGMKEAAEGSVGMLLLGLTAAAVALIAVLTMFRRRMVEAGAV